MKEKISSFLSLLSSCFYAPREQESPFLSWPPHYQFSQNLSIKLRNVGINIKKACFHEDGQGSRK